MAVDAAAAAAGGAKGGAKDGPARQPHGAENQFFGIEQAICAGAVCTGSY